MSLADLEEMEIGQFINKLNGFYEREKTLQKAEWERTNFQIYSALLQNPYIESHHKPKTFDEYMKGRNSTVNTIKTKKQLESFLGFEIDEKK